MAAVTTETRHATHLHIPAPARAVARGGGQILALACAAQFVVVLDIAIVNVGLPSIQRDLGVSESALQWVVIAYGLLLGGFRLFGGRMSDLLGRRRLFLTGVGTFAAASLLAGGHPVRRPADHGPRAAGLRAGLVVQVAGSRDRSRSAGKTVLTLA